MSALQEPETLKKTPLYDRHVSLQGKIISFGGWALPVYYTGIIAEHRWVRESCGFFDVSHLGEIHVKGPGAFQFLQQRLTNDLTKGRDGGILYTLLCNEQGRTLDDILVYQEAKDDYYLIVNASNIAKDLEALKKYVPDAVTLDDKSDEMACIAVQGPKAEAILEKLFGFRLKDMAYYSFKAEKFLSEPVWISRSGYTGEDGFEIFSKNELAPKIWDKLAEDGKKEGALPAGLGARNTLRLEAGNVLYGHELDESTTPLEAGLSFAVSFEKGAFVGRDALLSQKKVGVRRKLVGFRMLGKSIARDNYPIFKNGRPIGKVTSGSFGPTAGANIGLGYVNVGHETIGNGIQVEIHGRREEAEIVKTPFIPLKHKRSQKGF